MPPASIIEVFRWCHEAEDKNAALWWASNWALRAFQAAPDGSAVQRAWGEMTDLLAGALMFRLAPQIETLPENVWEWRPILERLALGGE